MARGMANDEPINSQAQTKEYDEGYERTFGKDRKPVRGRWVYDEAQQKLVPADQYVAPERAVDAPILSGRFYENQKATDGEDIGSRRKHKEYMARHGVTAFSDYGPDWEARVRKQRDMDARKAKRERIERKFWEIQNDRTKKGH